MREDVGYDKNMKTTFLAIRAVGAELARRIFVPVAIGAAVVAALVIVLMTWLTVQSGWWWFLAAPTYVALLISAASFVLAAIIIRHVSPAKTAAQRDQVNHFVDKFQRVAEIKDTPLFVLLFRVVRDVIRPQRQSFVQGVVKDTTSLEADFKAIINGFSDSSPSSR